MADSTPDISGLPAPPDISGLPTPPAPEPATADSDLVAGTDAAVHYARAAVGQLAGGFNYLGSLAGTLAAGASLSDADKAAQEDSRSLVNDITGQPYTSGGKALVANIAKVTDPVTQAAQKKFTDAADKTYEQGIPVAPGVNILAGTPFAGMYGAVVPQAAAYIFGGGLAKEGDEALSPEIPKSTVPPLKAAALPDAEFATTPDAAQRLLEAPRETALTKSVEDSAGKPATPPTKVVQNGSDHVATSPNGVTIAQEKPSGNLQVTNSVTDPVAQGEGEGTARLTALADTAHAKGAKLESDVSVSPPEAAAYMKLASQGYAVDQNKGAQVNAVTGNLVSDDPRRPVFVVGPKETPPVTGQSQSEAPPVTGQSPSPAAPGATPAAPAAPGAPPPPAGGAGTPPGAPPPGAPPAQPSAPPGSIFGPPAREGLAQAEPTPAGQQSRVDTFKRLGLDEVRNSAITGDTRQAGTEFASSKLKDNPMGDRLSGVIDNEQHAIISHADDLVDNAGGQRNATPAAAGRTLSAPVDGFHQYLEDSMQRAYEVAKTNATGPIQLHGLQDFTTSHKSQFLNTVEGKQLLEGVQTRLKELGLTGPNETFNPATVEQAERFRQYLNDSWTPRTGKLVGLLKDHLDADVMRTAGKDVYKEARAIKTTQSKLIDEPDVVSKLLLPKNANRLGVNRAVDEEDIPSNLTGRSAVEVKHYVDVLHEAAKVPELKDKSITALNALRTQFAKEYYAAGTSTVGKWNQKSANSYLHKNEDSMNQVFEPGEMQGFKDNDNAARWLHMDRTYKGAPAEAHNFVAAGALKLAPHATTAGALAGHIPGAIAGFAAQKGAEALAERSAAANAEKLITKLGVWTPPKGPTLGQKIGGAKQRGGPKFEPPETVAGYHGSPVKGIMSFSDPSRAGSGIGAAARGHGLYIAGDKPGADIYAGKTGQTYKVSAPSVKVSDMLHWDKPATDNPQAAKVFAAHGINGKDLTGGEAYEQLSEKLVPPAPGRPAKGEGHAAASHLLDQVGVPGISYSASGKYSQGGSTARNAVIFNPARVKIEASK